MRQFRTSRPRRHAALLLAAVLTAGATGPATAQDDAPWRLQVSNGTGYDLQIQNGEIGDGLCQWQDTGMVMVPGAGGIVTMRGGGGGPTCDVQLTLLSPGSATGAAGMLVLTVNYAGTSEMIVDIAYGPRGADGAALYAEPILSLAAPAMGPDFWRLDLAKVGAWLRQHPPAGG